MEDGCSIVLFMVMSFIIACIDWMCQSFLSGCVIFVCVCCFNHSFLAWLLLWCFELFLPAGDKLISQMKVELSVGCWIYHYFNSGMLELDGVGYSRSVSDVGINDPIFVPKSGHSYRRRSKFISKSWLFLYFCYELPF